MLCAAYKQAERLAHTQYGPKVLGLIFFKNRRHNRKIHNVLNSKYTYMCERKKERKKGRKKERKTGSVSKDPPRLTQFQVKHFQPYAIF
jgi:hypothetical protein